MSDPFAEEAPAAARSAVRQVPVGAEDAGQRLDKVLARLLPGIPRTRVFRLIRKGEVRLNGKRTTPQARVAEGDVVRVPPVREATAEELAAPRRVPATLIEQIERAIIHQDDKVLVLDKPAGVAVHGGSGLSFGVIEALRSSRPQETLELAHRLDRDTSGVLLVARRNSALRTLHALLREGAVTKSYLVLVKGRWELGHKQIDAPLDTEARVGGERTVRVAAHGKQALTDFRLVQQFGPHASLLEATILTGRTHQIRVHAAYAGHPVAGDEKYGDETFNAQMQALGLTRMFLHAHSCSLQWPGAGGLDVSAPLPDALKAALDALSGQRGARLRGAPPVSKRAEARRETQRETLPQTREEVRPTMRWATSREAGVAAPREGRAARESRPARGRAQTSSRDTTGARGQAKPRSHAKGGYGKSQGKTGGRTQAKPAARTGGKPARAAGGRSRTVRSGQRKSQRPQRAR
ncbi:MAG: RluA family pseudouridine synthase [Steroidobacteraceae bacterium]